MDDDQTPPKTLPSLPLKSSESESEEKKIAAILSRLSLHYWRPEFSPSQLKLMIADYLDDLRGYSAARVERACREFRQNGENKFFPKSGEILDLMKDCYALPPSHLQPFEGLPALEGPRATKSVAQVLEEHGFIGAAMKWKN